ncbi:MAG: amino acid permease, partial [Bacteroidetes bacterium]
LFPYFWSGIALLKKEIESGVSKISTKIIVAMSSIFIISAFVSATLYELWLVIALVIVVMAVYSLKFTKKKS